MTAGELHPFADGASAVVSASGSLGHPFDATGTRDVLTLATELRERNARYGAVGVSVRSGQAVTVVLENPCAF